MNLNMNSYEGILEDMNKYFFLGNNLKLQLGPALHQSHGSVE